MPAPRDPTTIRVPGAGDVPIGVDPNSQAGIPSNLPGTVPGGWDPAYGGVPQIPDPIASAWQAIGGDLSTLPQLFTLGNAYNLFNFGQQQQELQKTPSYQNVLSLMGGQVPRDVLYQIQQGAAERAIGGGQQFGDSPNANAAYLRALGLSSIDLQKLGQQEYGALAGLYPMGAPFNLMNFLTTPDQMQAALFAANQSAAAPNPRAAADEEFRKLLAGIEAGKGSLPGGGVGAPPIGLPGGSVSGGLTAPPGQTVGTGPPATVNRGTSATPYTPFDPNAGVNYGPNPMQGPMINPSTGAFTPFQGPAINPVTGQTSGGFQGPAINPWTGAPSGGYQGPAIDPWTGGASGGFQGPAIDPWTGQSTLPTEEWWNDPNFLFPGEQDFYSGGTNPATTDWWTAFDPWAALSGTDWGAPSPDTGGAGPAYDWWNDPSYALPGEDFSTYATDYPDWAMLPGEDYYGP